MKFTLTCFILSALSVAAVFYSAAANAAQQFPGEKSARAVNVKLENAALMDRGASSESQNPQSTHCYQHREGGAIFFAGGVAMGGIVLMPPPDTVPVECPM